MSGISSASPLAEGLRRALPIVLGYLPVGFAFGVLAVKNNIPPSLLVAWWSENYFLTIAFGIGLVILARWAGWY